MQGQVYFTPEKVYQIKIPNKDTYLGVEKTNSSPIKIRNAQTRYVFTQKLSRTFLEETNIRWKLVPVGSDNIYKILVADGQFKNHQLYCFDGMQTDHRIHQMSYAMLLAPLPPQHKSLYVFIAPQDYTKTLDKSYNKWQITKVANQRYSIKNCDSDSYLNALETMDSLNFKVDSKIHSDMRINTRSAWVYDGKQETFWEISNGQ